MKLWKSKLSGWICIVTENTCPTLSEIRKAFISEIGEGAGEDFLLEEMTDQVIYLDQLPNLGWEDSIPWSDSLTTNLENKTCREIVKDNQDPHWKDRQKIERLEQEIQTLKEKIGEV